ERIQQSDGVGARLGSEDDADHPVDLVGQIAVSLRRHERGAVDARQLALRLHLDDRIAVHDRDSGVVTVLVGEAAGRENDRGAQRPAPRPELHAGISAGAGEGRVSERTTRRYWLSRSKGSRPVSRIMRSNSCRVIPEAVVAPAACVIVSSTTVPTRSSAPKKRATCASFVPIWIQYALTCGKLSRRSLETAITRRSS